MAGKKLEYQIGVDSTQGVKGVKDFGRAVSQELKNVEDDFADTATAGERVATVLSKMAGQLDIELGEAAQAADALRAALGEDLAGRADVGSIIADLQRMGLSMDEIVADADKLGAALKELDDVQMRGLGSGLGGVKTSVGDIGKSADSSRSALANMIGNTTQDLGALGGIAGSAGVAIGQMGEYAADAALGGEKLGSALKSMALVAGPIAALTLATQTFATILGGIKAEKVFKAELVEEFTEAIKDGTDEVEVLKKRIEETGELAFETGALGGGGFLGLGSAAKDIIPILNELNISFEDWQTMLEDTSAVDRYRDKGLELASTNVELATKYLSVADALETYQDSIGMAGVKQDELNKFMGETVDNTDALAKQQKDYAAQLGIANSRLTSYADVQRDVLANQLEMGKAIAQTIEGLAAYRKAAKTVDWKQADIEGAIAGMEDFRDAHFGLAEIAQNSAEAERALGESVKENGKNFDLGTEAGLKNLDAIRGLTEEVDVKLAAAYDKANGNQRKFNDSAKEIADTTLARLAEQMGLSEEQTAELAEALGLMPEDIATRYELSGTEEAQLKLDLLSTSIDDLPKDVKAKVTQEIIKGDYVGALEEIQDYYDDNPAILPVKPVLMSSISGPGIPFPEDLGRTATAGTRMLGVAPTGTTLPTVTVPVAAPAAAGGRTQIVNVYQSFNAAAMGAPFDIATQLDAAMRQAARLLPKTS